MKKSVVFTHRCLPGWAGPYAETHVALLGEGVIPQLFQVLGPQVFVRVTGQCILTWWEGNHSILQWTSPEHQTTEAMRHTSKTRDRSQFYKSIKRGLEWSSASFFNPKLTANMSHNFSIHFNTSIQSSTDYDYNISHIIYENRIISRGNNIRRLCGRLAHSLKIKRSSLLRSPETELTAGRSPGAASAIIEKGRARTAPRSADRWTMTRRSTWPPERL